MIALGDVGFRANSGQSIKLGEMSALAQSDNAS